MNKLFIIVYTYTSTLVLLKLVNEIDWSWWYIFSAVIIYETLGFIHGFVKALRTPK